VLPALIYGDAVSNHAIEIREILRNFGYNSNIYAKWIHPKVAKFAKPIDKYKKNAANIVIYHLSLAGLDVSDFVKRLPDTKVLIYHNITPHHYFEGIYDTLYDLCKQGREELKLFNGITKLALGVSEYNRQELERYGFKDTGVLPIIIDYSKYEIGPDKETMRKYDNGGYVNLLFVGRISPNKRIEDLIKVFYYYKKINPKSRLFIVGSSESMEKYLARLHELVKNLELSDVVFTGLVSFKEMVTYYRIADVFLCMSEHEGFCVPLLESMYFNIPIIAYNATAVPYTLANCGVLVNEKHYDEIAEMVHLLISDVTLRKKIVDRQNERLKDFEGLKMEKKLKNYIDYSINSTKKEETTLRNYFEKYPSVSVVICTYNRAKYLERCIKSLKEQTYPNFEMIVVNGPSTDETAQVLDKYQEIQVVRQEELNGLSFARNLGIAAANGEIIAFIDDDAVADENWIEYLVAGYTDDSVGGVGGLVYGPQKTHLQFDRGTINKCAIPTAIRNKDGKLRKGEFPILMGTNSSFRKDVLYEVDGFDPYFRYYHDETDLCVRIAKKGYEIVYQRDAFVIHDMLEGHNRNSPYDLNWTEIMKNVIYFTLKNFRGAFSSYTVRPVKSLFWWLEYFASHYLNKNISLKQLFDIYLKLVRGAMKGYTDGIKVRETKNNLADITTPDGERELKICFLIQEYSKNCHGGNCRHTYDLAHTFAEFGNEVHVITKSEKGREYEYRDGNVFVHEIVPEPMDFLALSEDMHTAKKNLAYSYSACLKLLELIDKFGIQIAEAPLWDGEGFVFSLVKPIPLVVRLVTPLFKVAEIQGWQLTKDLKFANWMEGETVRRADKAIAISNDIGTLISSHHTIPQEKIELCPLGTGLPDESLLLRNRKENGFDVLFVGRLEKRKGVETLFRAIPQVLEKVPDAQFHIVGMDTNLAPNGGSYREFLLQNLDKKYHKKVRFVGYVDDNELKDYYRNCDIFVAPSLYESFGLIYLEAMAWGKPVIGCDAGGAPETIEGGETGIIIQPEDENALAEAIMKLKDEGLRSEMGEKGRRRVENDFSNKIMAENTYKIYNDVINYVKTKDLEEIKNIQIAHHARMKEAISDERQHNVFLQNLHFRYKTYINDLFPSKPCKVLDIGCGYAEILFNYLSERGHTYYGVDLYEDVVRFMEKVVKDQGDGSYIKVGMLEDIPFDDHMFDVAYASHILEHTYDIDMALKECKRVLREDGCIIFAMPCGYDDEPAHLHNRTKEGWQEDFERNGLLIERDGQFEFNNNEYYGRAIKKRSDHV
jgi:glycosyltransferase involved in cell wall biosynthesis/SAM-dependent methyltransferase